MQKGEREYFQIDIGKENIRQNSNDNGVRIVKFAT